MPGDRFGFNNQGAFRAYEARNAAQNSSGASGSSGTGFPPAGTYDYKADAAQRARAEAQEAGERSDRAYRERQIEKEDEAEAWKAELKKLKADSIQKGCKTLEKRFAETVKEADDVVNGRLEKNSVETADLGEELLTATSCGNLGAMYQLNQLVGKGKVTFEDYLAMDAFKLAYAKLYQAHYDSNFFVKTRHRNDKEEQKKVEKESVEIFNKVDMAYRHLHDQPVSKPLIKHMREGFEKWVGPALHCSELDHEETLEDGFASVVSKLLIHNEAIRHSCLTDNHYVIKEGESWFEGHADRVNMAGDADCCTIL